MLLDIQEPGTTSLPQKETVAVGIDLGTTNSVIAVLENEECKAIGDILPSVVAYNNNDVIVGEEALSYDERFQSVKRHMGQDSEEVPVRISADILKALKQRAEQSLQCNVNKAVITVPAYFDDAARQATKDAAQLAGLKTLRLINEPTAAALAYGLDTKADGIYAIYDLGGGTFDISILKLQKGVFQVLSTGGDTALGGDDFDNEIAEYFVHETNIKPFDQAQVNELMAIARQAKEHLSQADKGSWTVLNKECHLSKKTFEQLIHPFVDRSIMICKTVLEDAGLAKEDIDGVVLVGGSTRVPLVQAQVQALFGDTLLTNVDPDRVVAYGAAIQAHGLTQGSNNLLLDVTPLSLGIETMGGLVEKIIERNTPIPVAKSQEFTTYKDGQTGMKIHVLQGEREMVDQCRSLAHFELHGIPPMKAGIARIKVTFTLDADGLLTVSACEETTNTVQTVEVKPSYGLPPEKVETMLRESFDNAKEDIMERLLAESRIDAQVVLHTINDALAEDSDLLEATEKQAIEVAIDNVNKAIEGTNRDAIDFSVQELDKIASNFAEKRVNKALTNALKGRNIETLEESI